MSIFDRFRKPKESPPLPVAKKAAGLFTVFRDGGKSQLTSMREIEGLVFQQKAIATGEGMDSATSIFNAGYSIQSNTIPMPLLEWYAGQSFIGFQTCAVIAQNWLVDKACTMPARDAVRNGWEVTKNDGEEMDAALKDYIEQRDKAFDINANLTQFVGTGRVFGIRVAMFHVSSTDPDYYEKPFNPDGITPGSYKGISQIDPYWISPILDGDAASNFASKHFYEPTWWNIGGKRIHRTHLVIFRGPEVADVLKPSYQYAGLSIPQRIYERVYAAERTANEAPMLAMSKRVRVLATDLEAVLANQGSVETAMSEQARYLNNYGTMLIGQDDQYHHHDTSLADFDAVLSSQYQLVAAIANVPVAKLLGTTPKGFNATGEFEEANYHEELASIQSSDMQKMLDRHYLCLTRSELAPKFKMEGDITVRWNALDEPTGREVAEVNQMKANTAAMLAQIGAIDGQDERERLIADPDSGYNGMEAEESDWREALTAMDAEFKEDNVKRDEDGKFSSSGAGGGAALETLNPTGGIFVDYTPEKRDKIPLGKNITTYDKTANLSPDTKITIYRGVPKNVNRIQSGDFITTNKQLAKDYAGDGKVLSKEVRADEILDDITYPLGEEYILREKPKKHTNHKIPSNEVIGE